MTLGEIIKAYRMEHQLSMDAFAEKSGMSKAYISLLEKNKHPKTGKAIAPSVQMIKQAADGMSMDFNDLFQMIDSEVTISGEALPTYYNIHPIGTRRFPVLSSIACGEPILMQDERELYVDASAQIRADFVLVAKGDSMTGARIHDGDLVFIRSQPNVENGEIAAVGIGDEATLKRVFWYANKTLLVLRAENPKYPDLEYSGEALNNVHIFGKAVAFQSDVV